MAATNQDNASTALAGGEFMVSWDASKSAKLKKALVKI